MNFISKDPVVYESCPILLLLSISILKNCMIFIVILNVSFRLFLLNFLGCNSFRIHIEIVSKNVIGIVANVQQASCFERVRLRNLTEIQSGFQKTLTGYGI